MLGNPVTIEMLRLTAPPLPESRLVVSPTVTPTAVFRPVQQRFDIPALRPVPLSMVALPATEAMQALAGAEANLGMVRGGLERLRRVTLQAVSDRLRPAERLELHHQAQGLVRDILYLTLAVRISDLSLLESGGILLEVVPPVDEAKRVSQEPLPPGPRFEIPAPSFSLAVLETIDLTSPSGALGALQLIYRAIENLTEFQHRLSRARTRLESSGERHEEPAPEGEIAEKLQAQREEVLRHLSGEPRAVAAAQAHLDPRGVLGLVSEQ